MDFDRVIRLRWGSEVGRRQCRDSFWFRNGFLFDESFEFRQSGLGIAVRKCGDWGGLFGNLEKDENFN